MWKESCLAGTITANLVLSFQLLHLMPHSSLQILCAASAAGSCLLWRVRDRAVGGVMGSNNCGAQTKRIKDINTGRDAP